MAAEPDRRISTRTAPTASSVFQSFDLDGNGVVSRAEMTTSLEQLAAQHKLALSKEKVTAMTEVIFQSAKNDLEGNTRRNSNLSPEDWNVLSRTVLDRRLSYAVLENLENKTFTGKIGHFYKIYKQQFWWLTYFYLLQIVLFGIGVQRYLNSLKYNGRDYSDQGMLSMGVAQMVAVDLCILVFLPAYRFLVTHARRTFLAKFIPFDSWTSFHIVVGTTTVFLGLLHGGLYILNLYVNSLKPFYISGNWTVWRQLTVAGFIGDTWLGYTSVSGLILIGCMVVLATFAFGPVRNSTWFDAFYWTHKLQWVIWATLIVHSTWCWVYLIVPLTVLVFEKSLKYYNTIAWSSTTRILQVNLLPSNVTQLVVRRPASFKYNPGDYVFIKVPRLGVLNWHPFTLSSCPEQSDVLWFHIKASGDWTRELQKFFEKKADEIASSQTTRPASAASADGNAVDLLHMQPVVPTLRHIPDLDMRIWLDGPYGASTTALFNAEHAVLIGAGIGVTPFASVLGSVLAQFRQIQGGEAAARATSGNHGMAINERRLKLKKLDFIWVSRESENVQWFIDLLDGWEEQQQALPGDKLFMDCQLYVSSIPDKKNVTFAGLSIGMDLHHKVHNKDVITGLRTSTRAGRPDWPTLFAKIDRHKQGSVRVFYCGPPVIEQKIRWLSGQHKFKFSKESF